MSIVDSAIRTVSALGHRLLNLWAPEPSPPSPLVAAIEAGLTRSEYLGPYSIPGLTRSEYLGPYTSTPTGEPHPHPVDVQHHGGAYGITWCRFCGNPTLGTIGGPCPHCGKSSLYPAAGVAAGTRPGVVSAGPTTAAPTPGHLNSVESIAAIIGHHTIDYGLALDGDGELTTTGVRCAGLGCSWTGTSEPDHARHVAELIDAMLAADQRITRYLNLIRQK